MHQVTALLGGPGYAWEHPNRYALLLLNTVLGDGMSSKLFQSVRESLGLVYTIYSSPEFPDQRRRLRHRVRHRAQGHRQGHQGNQQAGQGPQEGRPHQGRTGFRQGQSARRHPARPGIDQHAHGQPFAPAHVRQGRRNHRKIIQKLEAVKAADVRKAIKDVFHSKRWASAAIVPKKFNLSMGKLLDF